MKAVCGRQLHLLVKALGLAVLRHHSVRCEFARQQGLVAKCRTFARHNGDFSRPSQTFRRLLVLRKLPGITLARCTHQV